MAFRVAFLGFGEFERNALTSYFRLAHHRHPSYEPVANLTDADYLIADADHGPSVQLVLAIERTAETVFIGAQAPAGSVSWMMRPIDALQVMRQLDALVGSGAGPGDPRDAPGQQTTIIRAARHLHGGSARTDDASVLLGYLPLDAPDAPDGPEAAAAAAATPAEVTPAEAAPEAQPDTGDETTAATPLEVLPPLTLRDPPTATHTDTPMWPVDLLLAPVNIVAHEPPLPVRYAAQADSERIVLPAVAPATTPAPMPAITPTPRPAPVTAKAAPAVVKAAPAVARPAAVAAPRQPKSPKPPKQPKARLLPDTPRALIVDDSAIATLYLAHRLARWPLQVDQASSSQQALALLAQHSHDLVFLDVELGEASELDGLGLCQRIKQTPALMHTLVVMVSAHHSELDRVRGALAGCDAYLGKPLDLEELQRLLLRQGLAAPASSTSTHPHTSGATAG